MASHGVGTHAPTDARTEEPYNIFTKREKWTLVSLVSFGMLFSPLSANIYFPAIPTLVVAFHKSTELINLTVTLNMIFQGLSPMFWGPLADTFGRRFMFIACLVVLALSCIGLAQTPTSDYWLLLFLRCFQAFGSASTIALGAGVVGDISTRAERGGFFGVSTMGSMLGPAIGPVVGGALADKLGWRAIFWFLCISSAFCAVVLILFLPETLRAIVGNGSIPGPNPFLHSPLIPVFGRGRRWQPSLAANAIVKSGSRVKFRNPFPLLLNPEIFLTLLVAGVTYALCYAVLTTISTLFKAKYLFLTETTIGLCFLAWGFGALFATFITGKMLDWDYRRLWAKHTGSREEFSIEKARLHLLPYMIIVYVVSCIGYGWCIDRRTNIAGPLVILFIISYLSTAIMNSLQTLMLDLMPMQASSVIACNNFVRCSLGAALVSAIEPLLDALGAGWAYVLLGGFCLVLTVPAIWVLIRVGPRIRAKKAAKLRRDADAEEAGKL
uniref:Major facilitator superfamily (MFS) profile domain-containing protein n=1 Tax=Mycena chlorophos TaxID=658473 RepID=A0ABQ0L1G1_MYCCL|nr:predicted protein [Mycena chlorophos]